MILDTIDHFEKPRTSIEIDCENQILIENLVNKQNEIILIFRSKISKIRLIMQEGIILKSDYNKIRNFCNKVNINNIKLNEEKEENIEVDCNLDKALEEIKKQLKQQITFKITLNPLQDSQLEFVKNIKESLSKQKVKAQNKEEFIKLSEDIINIAYKIILNELQATYIEKQYKLVLYKKMPQLENLVKSEYQKINITNFNNIITTKLLKESNYELIFNYIYILQCFSDYSDFKDEIHKFKLAPKKQNKDIILKITNRFIKKREIYPAFQFLKNISISNYFEYLPKSRTESEYIDIVKREFNFFSGYQIQKDLFFEKNYKKYQNTIECSKAWLQYLDESCEIKKESEIAQKVLHEIFVIINILKEDINILENDEYIRSKIDKFPEECKKYNAKPSPKNFMEAISKLINKILENKADIAKKVNIMKYIEKINCFIYSNDGHKSILYSDIKFNFNTIKTKSETLFKVLIDKTNKEDVDKLIYIYLNSILRYKIPIEKFVSILIEKNYKNIFENLNKYNFYGTIVPMKNGITYRINLLNITNENRTNIEKDDLEYVQDISKHALYKLDIKGYNEIFNELLFDNIKIYKQEEEKTNELDTYVKIYKDAANTNFEKIEKSEISFKESDILQIAELQIQLLENLNNNIIKKIMLDNINPYKYIKYDDFIKEVSYIKRKKLIERIQNYKEITKTLKEKHYENVKLIYKNLFINYATKAKEILYYYMNTSTKYIININDFLDCIIEERVKNNILAKLNEYEIIFKEIDENNNIKEPLQVETENIKYTGNPIKKDFANKLAYLKGNLEYDINSNKLYISKLYYTDLPRNSKGYNQLIRILDEFVEIKNINVLEQLKKLEIILELKSDQNIKYAGDKYLLANYRRLYNMSVAILINNLELLKTFILDLRKNNYWKKSNDSTNYLNWHVNSIGEIKNIIKIFLENAKKDDPETVIYCYKNTYLKNVIPLDQLLKTIFRFNKEGRKIINERGNVNLKQHELTILANIENVNENHTIVYTKKGFDHLKVIIQDANVSKFSELSKQIYLKVEKYSTANNILFCKISKKYIRTMEGKYNDRQMSLCKRLLESNYKIEDISEFINDIDIEKSNIYGSTYVSQNYVDDFLSNERESLEQRREELRKAFKEFVIKEIQQDEKNIKYIFELYDKTIIRYIVPIEQFTKLVTNLGIELGFKVTIQINSETPGNYLAYFPRYRTINKVKFEKNEFVPIIKGKYYRVLIQRYDKNKKRITLKFVDEDMEKIIEAQVNLLGEVTEKVIDKTIDELLNDLENPYKYISYKELNMENYTEKFKEIRKYKDIPKRLKEKYYNKVKENYKSLFDKKISTKSLITFYMNTATRYILTLNEFLEMIILRKTKSYTNLNLRTLFDDCEIFFRKIDSENNIIGLLQIQVEKGTLKYSGKETLNDVISGENIIWHSLLKSYNTEEKTINLGEAYCINLEENDIKEDKPNILDDVKEEENL